MAITLLAALAAAAIALAWVASSDPTRALLWLLVIGVAVTCALRADIALLGFVAIVPLEAQYEVVPVIGQTPAKTAGALCFASFALYALRSRVHLVFDMSHALVVLLLGLALVSTVQAREIDPALTTTLRYASFIALYFVASQFVGDHRLQRRIAWTISIASTIAALIALNHFFFGHGYVYRANLEHGDPNQLAFILATSLPFTFWLLNTRWLIRPLVLAMIVLISLAIVFTYSRGALVAIGAAIAFLMATDRKRVPLLAFAAVLTVTAGFAFVRSNPETVTRIEDAIFAKEKVAAANIDARLTAWNAAADLAVSHPILGIGPGNFYYHYSEATGSPAGVVPVNVVHNAYLDIASELGLIGLTLFLAYLVLIFARLTDVKRDGTGPPGLAAALRVSLVIAVVGAITLSEHYSAPFWLVGGLATALWMERREISGRFPALERLAPPRLRPAD